MRWQQWIETNALMLNMPVKPMTYRWYPKSEMKNKYYFNLISQTRRTLNNAIVYCRHNEVAMIQLNSKNKREYDVIDDVYVSQCDYKF